MVDEIQMGFWRTGTLWSVGLGVNPDVLVFAKALTNGLNALSGLWAREELINPTIFPPGSTHSTFASNPLGTALNLEVMKAGNWSPDGDTELYAVPFLKTDDGHVDQGH